MLHFVLNSYCMFTKVVELDIKCQKVGISSKYSASDNLYYTTLSTLFGSAFYHMLISYKFKVVAIYTASALYCCEFCVCLFDHVIAEV